MSNKMLVKDLMISIDKVPIVDESAILKEALEGMCDLKIGICCIIESKKTTEIYKRLKSIIKENLYITMKKEML